MKIVTLTEAELRELLKEAASDAVSQLRADLERSRTPELMDRAQVAKYLSVHRSTVNRLMRDGMPFEPIYSTPRFRKSEIDHWLKGRAQ
jgi:excisionase family DNA binding protein